MHQRCWNSCENVFFFFENNVNFRINYDNIQTGQWTADIYIYYTIGTTLHFYNDSQPTEYLKLEKYENVK